MRLRHLQCFEPKVVYPSLPTSLKQSWHDDLKASGREPPIPPPSPGELLHLQDLVRPSLIDNRKR
jgi:hypothetical protein